MPYNEVRKWVAVCDRCKVDFTDLVEKTGYSFIKNLYCEAITKMKAESRGLILLEGNCLCKDCADDFRAFMKPEKQGGGDE